MSRRTLAGSGALLLVVASLHAPAAAHAAPAMWPLEPCYVTADTSQGPQSEGVRIIAVGFTPNALVDLSIDGAPYPGGEGLKAGPNGELPIDPVPAPFVESGSAEFTVTLTERGNPANTVSATAMSTALGVDVKPKRAEPSDRIRFNGLGFTRPKAVYAHYLYKGKVRKTVRMARKTGKCGGFKARRRQIPVKNPGLGGWTIQFDQYKRFRDPAVTPIVYVRLEIRIRLVRD
jgi:hypothetical protein